MCLAIPAEIVSVDRDKETAIAALGPVRKEISVALIEDPAPGDFVLIHVGFALHKLSPDEAEVTLALMRSAGDSPEAELSGEVSA
jgi:hydrogenase expression/formation protein HypC